ncbi:MAG: OadG family protein, partial [Clostridiales bacterium]|nr:OadG family protein [Clostridiales bacterium]
MSTALHSASDMSLSEGAVFALIGFLIVLAVLALLVGIFYLSGFIFQSKLFNKQKDQPAAVITPKNDDSDDEADEQLVAVITAAVACMLEEE